MAGNFFLLSPLLNPPSKLSFTFFPQPIFHPPAPDFNRTVDIKVSFGYTPPAVAARALLRPSPFANDPPTQALYESYLRAQTGESQDHFTRIFSQLSQFNDNTRLFVTKAREAIKAKREREAQRAAEALLDADAPPMNELNNRQEQSFAFVDRLKTSLSV